MKRGQPDDGQQEASATKKGPRASFVPMPVPVPATPAIGGWTTDASWLENKEGETYKRVAGFYRKNHSHQTYEYATAQKAKYSGLTHGEAGIFDILGQQTEIFDESDPDLAISQIAHCYQTAEALRRRFPDEQYDWLHLVGLIHDVGKVLLLWGEPQWATGGDTFPVGCKIRFPQEKLLYPGFVSENPDMNDPRYSTDLGVYTAGCGLDNVHMSWGHDEYLYQVLAGNETKLPREALYLIRYHSFWAWHYAGEYEHLLSETDRAMLPWMSAFRECDLYSKDDANVPNPAELEPYYRGLAKKYLPDVLKW